MQNKFAVDGFLCDQFSDSVQFNKEWSKEEFMCKKVEKAAATDIT